MSRKIKERTKELAAKEAELKSTLLGRSSNLQSKANRVGKVAIVGGITTLMIYMVYRSVSDSENEEKPKKAKYVRTASSVIAEKLIVFLLPYLGKFLDRLLSDFSADRSSSKQETEEES